jgi:hypothetical protein
VVVISHWSFVICGLPIGGVGGQGAVTRGVKQMQSEKWKVKNAKLKEKNTFMGGGIRRSGEAVFGES